MRSEQRKEGVNGEAGAAGASVDTKAGPQERECHTAKLISEDALKPLDEKRGGYFHDLGGGTGFSSKAQNPEAIKEKPDGFDYIKIKRFCMSKYTINKVKRYLTGRKYLKHVQQITVIMHNEIPCANK